MAPTRRSWWLSIVVALSAGGCDGQIADPTGTASAGPGGPGADATALCAGAPPSVSVRPLRRLTSEQYERSVRDLLGDPGFDPEVTDDAEILTDRGVRQLRVAAELALDRRAQWTETVFPCDAAGAAGDACVEGFLDGFARRAFRRPLTDDERAWLGGVYRDAEAALGFAEALEVLLAVVLQSPQLVYVHERGVARDGLPEGIRALDDFEVASRLGYFLWNTTPDAELLAAAGRGELTDPAGLRAMAERMIDDPRARETVQRFFWTWLQLDGGRLHHPLEETTKDAGLYPEYDEALRAAMRTELEGFVTRTFFEEGAGFDALLTDPSAYVNGPLAALYGVEGGPTTADDWRWVELDGAERGGLLTRAAFLTVFASAGVQSPIRRGVFVIEEVLCNGLGEPPPNVSDVPVTGGEVEGESGETELWTVRQDVEARTSGEPCSTCHGVINPVGFTFEHYDAIGRWRSEELTTGLPIDSSGHLRGSGVDAPMPDAVALSRALARSDKVRQCFADRWMTRALGAAPREEDRCARESIRERFLRTGDMRELLIAIVESDSFRYLAIPEEDR